MHKKTFIFFTPEAQTLGLNNVVSIELQGSRIAKRCNEPTSLGPPLDSVLNKIPPTWNPLPLGDNCIQVSLRGHSKARSKALHFAVEHRLGLAHPKTNRILLFGDELPGFLTSTPQWEIPAAPQSALGAIIRYGLKHYPDEGFFLTVENPEDSSIFIQAYADNKDQLCLHYRNHDPDTQMYLTVENTNQAGSIIQQWITQNPDFHTHNWQPVGAEFVFFTPHETDIETLSVAQASLLPRLEGEPTTSPLLGIALKEISAGIAQRAKHQLLKQPRVVGDQCIQLEIRHADVARVKPFLLDSAVRFGLGFADLFFYHILLLGNENPEYEMKTEDWTLPGISFLHLDLYFEAMEWDLFEQTPNITICHIPSNTTVVAEYNIEAEYWDIYAKGLNHQAEDPHTAVKLIQRALLQP